MRWSIYTQLESTLLREEEEVLQIVILAVLPCANVGTGIGIHKPVYWE